MIYGKDEAKDELIESSILKFSSEYKNCNISIIYNLDWIGKMYKKENAVFNEKEVQLKNLEPLDLYASLYNRGVNQLLKNDPCKTLQSISPSLDWQIENIKYVFSLTKKDRHMIGFYMGNLYTSMNRQLRTDPNTYPVLNEAIMNAPPLENDIVVLRYTGEYNLPKINEVFPYTGYMSTTFLSSYAVCTKYENLFRIKVPKGTRCLYIPVYEHELIFPHGTLLKITSINKEKLICRYDNENKPIENIKTVYNIEMLEQTYDLMPKGIKRYPEAIRELRLSRK